MCLALCTSSWLLCAVGGLHTPQSAQKKQEQALLASQILLPVIQANPIAPGDHPRKEVKSERTNPLSNLTSASPRVSRSQVSV